MEPGADVTLQCRGSRDSDTELLEWIKPDLAPEQYVLFFRENRIYKTYQNPLFRGRVELEHPEIKNGNFSVVLKNVDYADAGTYECRAVSSNSGISKRAVPELLDSINLKVEESGEMVQNDWCV